MERAGEDQIEGMPPIPDFLRRTSLSPKIEEENPTQFLLQPEASPTLEQLLDVAQKLVIKRDKIDGQIEAIKKQIIAQVHKL